MERDGTLAVPQELGNRLGGTFDSLGERMLWGHLAVYPEFVPVTDEGANIRSQKQMHTFLHGCLEKIYADLSIIGSEGVPDGCFLRWEVHKKVNPELDAAMNAVKMRFEALIACLIKIGCLGKIEGNSALIPRSMVHYSQKILDKFCALGLEITETKEYYMISASGYPDIFPAWKAYCREMPPGKLKEEDVEAFIRGSFGGKIYRMTEMYHSIADKEILICLEEYFFQKGYQIANDSNSIRYFKRISGERQLEMKCTFDWRKKTPLYFRLNIPYFKKVLESFEELKKYDAVLADTVFHSVPLCEPDCRFCIKNDRTGNRPKENLAVAFGDEMDIKCPYYPCLLWYEPDARMLREVTRLLDFAEMLYRRHRLMEEPIRENGDAVMFPEEVSQ